MTSGDRIGGEFGVVRLTVWVKGRVQGVGFRWWVRARALELGLRGWALNLPDGRVEVVAEGPRESCAALLDLLSGGDTPGQVTGVIERWSDPKGAVVGFVER
ncbi:acylphosphatase [Acrocarpospora macrocephala]|uniref:acylphosphatase n=1 Tax=Acrocarpospora macrocephala TaxID=150177 RepID=UPI0012D31853|nr:acylphosphatase [Acrocarpospora macrocephala]